MFTVDFCYNILSTETFKKYLMFQIAPCIYEIPPGCEDWILDLPLEYSVPKTKKKSRQHIRVSYIFSWISTEWELHRKFSTYNSSVMDLKIYWQSSSLLWHLNVPYPYSDSRNNQKINSVFPYHTHPHFLFSPPAWELSLSPSILNKSLILFL